MWQDRTTVQRENQFLAHHQVQLIQDGAPLFSAAVSVYDAVSAERANAGRRFLARPGSFLGRWAHYLFDPSSATARLPAVLREDLDGMPGGVLLLEHLTTHTDPPVPLDSVTGAVQTLMQHFLGRFDILLITNWQALARQLGHEEVALMDRLSQICIVPLDTQTLVGFALDLELFLP